MATARPTLHQLAQQLAEIVAAGEESGSQNGLPESNVAVRLRGVIITLIDQVILPATVVSREAASVLKLIHLTCVKVPGMLAGSTSTSLADILKRLLPLLPRLDLADIQPELQSALCRVTALMASIEPKQMSSIISGFSDLLIDAVSVAAAFSSTINSTYHHQQRQAATPGPEATIACFQGLFDTNTNTNTNHAHTFSSSLKLTVTRIKSCEQIIYGCTAPLVELLHQAPSRARSAVPPSILDTAVTLTLSATVKISVAGMHLLTALLRCDDSPQRTKKTAKGVAAVNLVLRNSDVFQKSCYEGEWKQAMLCLLYALVDSIDSRSNSNGSHHYVDGYDVNIKSSGGFFNSQGSDTTTSSPEALALLKLGSAITHAALSLSSTTITATSSGIVHGKFQQELCQIWSTIVAQAPFVLGSTANILSLTRVRSTLAPDCGNNNNSNSNTCRHIIHSAVMSYLVSAVITTSTSPSELIASMEEKERNFKLLLGFIDSACRDRGVVVPVVQVDPSQDDPRHDDDYNPAADSGDAAMVMEDEEGGGRLLRSGNKRRRLIGGVRTLATTGTAIDPMDASSLDYRTRKLKPQNNINNNRIGGSGFGGSNECCRRHQGHDASTMKAIATALVHTGCNVMSSLKSTTYSNNSSSFRNTARGKPDAGEVVNVDDCLALAAICQMVSVVAPRHAAALLKESSTLLLDSRAYSLHNNNNNNNSSCLLPILMLAVTALRNIHFYSTKEEVFPSSQQVEIQLALLKHVDTQFSTDGNSGGDDKGGGTQQLCAYLSALLLAAQYEVAQGCGEAIVTLLSRVVQGRDGEMRNKALFLLPVVCCLAEGKDWSAGGTTATTIVGSQQQSKRAKRGAQQQQQQLQHPANALLSLLKDTAVMLATNNDDVAGFKSFSQGLLLTLLHCSNPSTLVVLAIDSVTGAPASTIPAVLSPPPIIFGSSGSSSSSVPITSITSTDQHHHQNRQSTLPLPISAWSKEVLEQLAKSMTSLAHPTIAKCVITFLERASPGQMEGAKLLAQWLMNAAASGSPATRAAVLKAAPVLASESVILALYHKLPHPVHSKDRKAQLTIHDTELMRSIRQILDSRAGKAAKDSKWGPVVESLVQLLAHAGLHTVSTTASMFVLAVLTLYLVSDNCGVRCIAAEAMMGFAAMKNTRLSDLIVSSPKFLEVIGTRLSTMPGLIDELADTLDESPESVALAMIPDALPELIAKDDKAGLETLASAACMDLKTMLSEYGYVVVVKILASGDDSKYEGFEEFTNLLENVAGQTIVNYVRITLSKTMSEVIRRAGEEAEWYVHKGALPDSVYVKALKSFSTLKDTAEGSVKDSSSEKVENLAEVSAEFLANGDHVTRMLKEMGDELDRRLPPPGTGGASTVCTVTPTRLPATAESDCNAAVIALRCVILLIKLTGRFIERYLPQMMVLLAGSLRATNPPKVKIQGLQGWQVLTKALSQHAPVQLGGVMHRIAVVLIAPLQDTAHPGVVSLAAATIEELVMICKRQHREKLRSLPPIPAVNSNKKIGGGGGMEGGMAFMELQRVKALLQEERGQLTTEEHVELLVTSLADESVAVRATALAELKEVLSSRRDWLLSLLRTNQFGVSTTAANSSNSRGTDNNDLLSRLLTALLKCCGPEGVALGVAAQQNCAECLGILGAVDPSRVHVPPPPLPEMASSDGELLLLLMNQYLVRLLKSADSLQSLDATTYSIQELLRSYGQLPELVKRNKTINDGGGGDNSGKAANNKNQKATTVANAGVSSKTKAAAAATTANNKNTGDLPPTPASHHPHSDSNNALFNALPFEIQAIVRPYLGSKYKMSGSSRKIPSPIFTSTPNMKFRRWLALWITHLSEAVEVTRPRKDLYRAVAPVCRYDIPTALFILPYMVADAVLDKSDLSEVATKVGKKSGTTNNSEPTTPVSTVEGIQREVEAVLRVSGHSREGGLCLQAVFTLLDTLQRWAAVAWDMSGDSMNSRRRMMMMIMPPGVVTTTTTAAAESASATTMTGGGGGGSEGNDIVFQDWQQVKIFLESIPRSLLAQAAGNAGAHARALQYYETHVRRARNGGYNIAAARNAIFEDEDITFLLEVYSKLEEPDGLQGFIKLRPDGGSPRLEDQRLAAEKAGNWGEALALYEQALQHGNRSSTGSGSTYGHGLGNASKTMLTSFFSKETHPLTTTTFPGGTGNRGLSAAHRGYLNCLLHMGHWQALLTQVEGLASTLGPAGGGEAVLGELSALGTAAAWRLGRWDLLASYLPSSSSLEGEGPGGGMAAPASATATATDHHHLHYHQLLLDPGLKWEVRLGKLLAAAAGRDHIGLKKELEAARSEAMGAFSAAAMESYSRAYPHLIKLHMLQEATDVATLLLVNNSSGSKQGRGNIGDGIKTMSNTSNVVEIGPLARERALRWGDRLAVTQPSLGCQAPILALRRQLATISGSPSDAGKCWLEHARLCRMTGHYEAAMSAAVEASVADVPGAALERLTLIYDRGEPYRAVSELSTLVERMHAAAATAAGGGGDNYNKASLAQLPAQERAAHHAAAALQLAQWMTETGQGDREEVAHMFEYALTKREKWETAHFKFAAFLDQTMCDAKKRQDAANSSNNMGNNGHNNNGGGGSNVHGGRGGGLPQQDRLSGKSRIKLGEDRPHLEFLPEVIKHYGESLVQGHAHVYQSLPRMLTLWFEFGSSPAAMAVAKEKGGGGGGGARNAHEVAEREAARAVISQMASVTKSVPLHVWLTALPQLISRICHGNSEVATLIRMIVTQVTAAFPQPALWALAGVNKSIVTSRRVAANSIISSAKKHAAAADEMTRKLFTESASFCEQLIRLCNHKVSGGKKIISLKKELPHLCRTLPLGVMIPTSAFLTLDLPTSTTAMGGGGGSGKSKGGTTNTKNNNNSGWKPFDRETVTVASIQDAVDVLKSLQSPKKVTLIGSDGYRYAFLAKPHDDLRKDTRLMDVAAVLNRLFLAEGVSRRRGLKLRRFAVIPLTEDCGLIQWVNNTKGLRYCVQEAYTAEGMYNERLTNLQIKQRYDTFKGPRRSELLNTVLATMPPRFHKWLLSQFPEPTAWLAARLAFTTTHAVWCMVGHIVGLGDRHGENILVDCVQGDVVYVDFACLFDKALTLAEPEMVPFRLTQNVIDAMGVAGHEGNFRKSCEVTLSVLRSNKDAILSVMDSFVNDPLVEWMQDRRGSGNINSNNNSKDGHNMGGAGGGEQENPQAKDAMATMLGRLSGTLLGVSSRPCMPMSVEGQAHRLIMEASDKENLGKMYIWWMPWF
jgi:serine/threonine-protein kinase ATR